VRQRDYFFPAEALTIITPIATFVDMVKMQLMKEVLLW
jgi:hypothetical protein